MSCRTSDHLLDAQNMLSKSLMDRAAFDSMRCGPQSQIVHMPRNENVFSSDQIGRAEIIKKPPVVVPMPTDSLALMVQVQAALSGHPIQCHRVTQVILENVQDARKCNTSMTAEELLCVDIRLDVLSYAARVVVDAWMTSALIQVVDTRNISPGEVMFKEVTYEKFEAHKATIRKSQGGK